MIDMMKGYHYNFIKKFVFNNRDQVKLKIIITLKNNGKLL